MPGNIFINYRRDDSSGVAGRLHDSLAPKFGRNKLFMDVDNIPVGRDFEDYLNSQVAACDAMLAIIGPNWLSAKDETGQRRLDNPSDFIVIEIGAALARNIPVVPVLVDGAHMPKASELPDSLKPLARRQAIQVRHTNFNSDAEGLVKRLREALGYDSAERRWGVRGAIGVTALAVLLLIGWGGYAWFRHTVERGVQQAELKWEQEQKAAEAEAKRKADENEAKRRAAEAEAKRKADEAEQERQATAAANRKAEASRQRKEGEEASKARDYDRAIANYNEAIRLNQDDAIAYNGRGSTYSNKGDPDRAIADYNEAVRLDPTYALALLNRGTAYSNKGDFDRAIADFNDAIRLDPRSYIAFNNRGNAYYKKNHYDQALADFNEAIRINPMYPTALRNRGLVYSNFKDDPDRAIADYNDAIRLDPMYAQAFNSRGYQYVKKGDYSRAMADYNEAIRLDPKFALALCNRGMLKRKIDDSSGNADVAQAKQLDASVCR
jgi:tetratricopeptide (TPR) repeat protein